MLESLKTGFGKLLRNKRTVLISLLIGAIFIFIAIYTYNTYVKPRLNVAYMPNKEYITTGSDDSNSPGSPGNLKDSATLYYFYTVWCPLCIKARPIIKQLQDYIASKGGKIKGVTINIEKIDCDKDSKTADKYGVEGYPTIKLVHGSKVVEYEAKPELDTLKQFLDVAV